MSTKNILWTITFTLLFLTNILMWSGFSLLYSTMPLYAEDIGSPQSLIGLIMGVYPLFALLARPYAGYIYDVAGRKKVFLLSMLLITVATFGNIIATTILALIIARMLQGFFFGIATTGAGTIVADIVPADRRGEGVGYAGLGSTFSLAVGPIIGLWVMNKAGYTALFITSGTLVALAIVLSLFISYPQIKLERKKITLDNIIEKRVLSVAVITVIYSSLTGVLLTYVILFSEEIGIANGAIYFMLNAAGVAVSRLFAGSIMDKNGPRHVFLAGIIVTILGLLLLAASKEIILYSTASFILGLGSGIVMPTLQAMVINMVPADRRSAATATHLTFVDIGISGGSIVIGLFTAFTSLAAMFLFCAVMLVIPLLLFNLHAYKDYEAKTAEVKDMQEPAVTG